MKENTSKCKCDHLLNIESSLDKRLSCMDKDISVIKYQIGDLKEDFDLLKVGIKECSVGVTEAAKNMAIANTFLESNTIRLKDQSDKVLQIELSMNSINDTIVANIEKHFIAEHPPIKKEIKNLKNIAVIILLLIAASDQGKELIKFIQMSVGM